MTQVDFAGKIEAVVEENMDVEAANGGPGILKFMFHEFPSEWRICYLHLALPYAQNYYVDYRFFTHQVYYLRCLCSTNMTNYQPAGRIQKPRGVRVKQALQFTLILAICIWLLYQIKPSHNDHKNHGLSKWSKLSKEGKTLILGRKGSTTWSSDRSDFVSEGARLLEDNDAIDDSGTENWTTELVLDGEKALMEDDTDEISTGMESGSSLQHHRMVNDTISGHIEMEDGKHSFPDENGIPEELEKDYLKSDFDHLSISSTNVRSKMSESKAIPRQKSKQKNIVAEIKDDGTTADLENDIKIDFDLSTLKIMQVRSKDSDDSQFTFFKAIAIWNPAATKLKQCFNIPCLPKVFNKLEGDFGFGFDSVANDYKIMYIEEQPFLSKQPLLGGLYS
ncbi:hypothetical protein POM88_048056 [Heracleum sosnowskyi]|uniref:Uncharacterized protein n=1 Tax=Heracleum sosnowskyi TaxID=360622 RepID=A0AAD8GT64_9APIA|nr:hypothetical protein POM88_048056 [Heracleum sosnowskyi]